MDVYGTGRVLAVVAGEPSLHNFVWESTDGIQWTYAEYISSVVQWYICTVLP